MKVIYNILIISILINFTASYSYAQDGQSRTSADGGASFWLEPLWGTQIDPRWKAGEVIGDVDIQKGHAYLIHGFRDADLHWE